MSHPDVDKISLTGSAVAGKRVMQIAADRIARVTLELGGKSPGIVADDADLADVIPILVAGGLGLSGQVCLALTRVLVSAGRHDELVERLAAEFSAMRVGDPMDPETHSVPSHWSVSEIAWRATSRSLERKERASSWAGAVLAISHEAGLSSRHS